jgi:methylated-DNA-[protein]-cysteine S-methyltransferase
MTGQILRSSTPRSAAAASPGASAASTRCSCRWAARRRPAPASASAGDIAEAPPPAEVQRAIDGIVELLEGKPNDLSDVVLDLDGVPEFNRGVYDIARTIPPGKTMTYGDIAKRLGGVELSRDVGQALGRNPCPIVVPCHRVLAAGGKPGGFSANGGVVTKLKMLAIEGAAVNHTPSLFD